VPTCEGSLLDRKSSGIRIVVVGIRFVGVEEISRFLEMQVPLGGTQLAVRCHIRGAWCLIHEKCCFSYFSSNNNRRAVV